MLDTLERNAAFTGDDSRLAAVRRRDPAADECFLYSVATTGVYCRPSCAARPALRHNVAFHATRADAERAGFRACKRCRPDLPRRAEREAAMVASACRAIEAAEEAPALADLARDAGVSPHHFHRVFSRIAGVTPKAYFGAQRHARVRSSLAAGESVTSALYDAGFSSSGRFYAEADAMLGMTPSSYRAGAPGELLSVATGDCSLGKVLVAATERGVCAILLGDDAGALAADLRDRFPRARFADGDAATLARVIALIDRPRAGDASLPLDIRGTAFQRRVWEALRAIPAGETRTYTQVAAQLRAPSAVRAVAGACAANKLAVAVPCHRVVASTGALAGYRWGVARKRALLDRERA